MAEQRSIGQQLVDKQEQLKTDRATFDDHWAEVAPLVLPRQDDFFETTRVEGDRRTSQKFDDTAPLALVHGASAIESVVSPRGTQWHKIGLPEQIRGDQASQEWADRLNDFLFRKRYSPKANFASQLHEVYLSLLAFGNGILMIEDLPGHGIRYKSGHIAEHYFMENNRGQIDVDYRKYRMTARQAMEKFGEAAPAKVKEHYEKKPSEKLWFMHVVMPDEDNAAPGFEYVSYHVCCETKEVISVGGFRTFPYVISRWTTSPNEIYGRGPAMQILSEIKMLNAIRKTDLRVRHLIADPPILAADERGARRFSMRSGYINPGTLDQNGNPLVRPYQHGASIPTSSEAVNESREFINRAFFLHLFQILVDSPQQTATEVLQKAQEKGQLLTPTAGRQMSELLEPTVMREISIWEQYGIFEDGGLLELPPAVKEMEGEFSIEYTNPLTHMMRAEAALGAERTIQALLPMAEFDPSVMDKIDWNEYANLQRLANGAPAALFKSDEEMAALAQQRAQQQQMAQAVEAAPQMAGAIKDIAQAQALD